MGKNVNREKVESHFIMYDSTFVIIKLYPKILIYQEPKGLVSHSDLEA